jgi:hypothetical protein
MDIVQPCRFISLVCRQFSCCDFEAFSNYEIRIEQVPYSCFIASQRSSHATIPELVSEWCSLLPRLSYVLHFFWLMPRRAIGSGLNGFSGSLAPLLRLSCFLADAACDMKWIEQALRFAATGSGFGCSIDRNSYRTWP